MIIRLMKKIISFVIIVLLVLNVGVILLPSFNKAIVLSGSMEPALSVDDMIITHSQDSYKVDDIVSFNSGNSVVTHRIIDVTEKGYITKGDANNIDDGEILRDAVIGKVVLTIPYMGNILRVLYTPVGMAFAAFVLIIFSREKEVETSEKTE